MGSMTQALRSVTGADEAERRTKERLDLLLLAAKAKIQAYRDEINEAFLNPAIIDKKQIPGIRAIRFIEQYHVASRESFSTQVGDHLTAAIDAFFSIGGKDEDSKKAVQSGVKSLISAALDGFIGATSAGETEQKVYVVVPENNAFVRVDIACWKYNFTQEKIIAQSDSAVAYVLCKSVVDHSVLAIDELIYLATEALSKDAAQRNLNPDGSPRAPVTCADQTDNGKVTEALLKMGYSSGTITSQLANSIVKSKLKVKTPGAQETKSFGYDDVANMAAAQVHLTLLQVPSAQVPEAELDKHTWIQEPDILDTYSGAGRVPPSIGVVEAYIEELIRVWKKLKEDRRD